MASENQMPLAARPDTEPRKRTLPRTVIETRVAHTARATRAIGDMEDNYTERVAYLLALVEAEEPESEAALQMLLMKEVAYSNYLEFVSRSTNDRYDIGDQLEFAETALKYGKLYAQLQSEHEKWKRQGVQRFIIQNNAPVTGQSVFGDVNPQEKQGVTITQSASKSHRKKQDV